MKKIIGIAGTFASGKDTAADYIADKYGYLHVSTGDLIREETKNRGMSIHRDNLHVVANEMRSSEGGDVFVKRALEHFRKPGGKGLVVSGIRHPKEVEALEQAGGYFIFIDAPIKRRFEWAKGRGRLEDNTDFEGFKQQEEKELDNPDPSGQQIEKLRPLASTEIYNDVDLEDFQGKIDEIVAT